MVVKLPDEIDELEGYDAEKVQERNEVRTCCYFLSRLVFIDLTWTRSETDHASIGAKLVDEYVKRYQMDIVRVVHGATKAVMVCFEYP